MRRNPSGLATVGIVAGVGVVGLILYSKFFGKSAHAATAVDPYGKQVAAAGGAAPSIIDTVSSGISSGIDKVTSMVTSVISPPPEKAANLPYCSARHPYPGCTAGTGLAVPVGEAARARFKEIQRLVGVTQDGIFGPATLRAYNEKSARKFNTVDDLATFALAAAGLAGLGSLAPRRLSGLGSLG